MPPHTDRPARALDSIAVTSSYPWDATADMARLSLHPEYVALLVGAGFRPHVVRGLIEFEVYRRPAHGRWYLQARMDHEGRVDLGLTHDAGWATFIGPVHRASSATALASALPHITGSLEALAADDAQLRCPRCSSWTAMTNGRDGPILACAGRGKPHGSANGRFRGNLPCRGTLPLRALHLYGEAPAGRGALPALESWPDP